LGVARRLGIPEHNCTHLHLIGANAARNLDAVVVHGCFAQYDFATLSPRQFPSLP
jgi:hypothetical protein